MSKLGQVCAVLGAQWGDEGKGKVVDILAQEYDCCVRFNGGSNAGHTIKVKDVKFAFHLMPSGILNENGTCLIGNGCVVHIPTLLKEMQQLEERKVPTYKDRLKISDRAHLVFDFHMELDGNREVNLAAEGKEGGMKPIGTTRKGIGPTYMEKANRSSVRVCDLLEPQEFERKLRSSFKLAKQRIPDSKFDVDAELKKYLGEYLDQIRSMIVDGQFWINKQHELGKKILFEGANAAMLDLDHGTYPYVTSSSPTVGGCATGSGLAPSKINDVIGVVKAYTTRVGEGPFPTELVPSPVWDPETKAISDPGNPIGTFLRETGFEFGTTTKRPRRCGWFDAVVVKYTAAINGYTYINLTKLDTLTGLDELKIGVAYQIEGKDLTDCLMPSSIAKLEKCSVRYESFPGWKDDITKCTSFEALPENAQKYVRAIEKHCGVKVKYIGIGAGREDMIVI